MLWAPCCGANNQMERHQSKWKSCILPKDAAFLLWSSVFIARLISFIISSLCKLVLFSRRGGGGVWINIFSLVKLLHLFEADEDAEIFTTFGHGLTFLQLCGKCIGLNTNRGLAGVGRCAPGEGLDYPCGNLPVWNRFARDNRLDDTHLDRSQTAPFFNSGYTILVPGGWQISVSIVTSL